jgi:glycosyltransferase involved in cell wall biosynthesis
LPACVCRPRIVAIQPERPVKIAYVLNTYPAPSHSFIRREIRALERHGLTVFRLAMRPWDGPLADPADVAEAEATEYVLKAGVAGFLSALWQVLLLQPGGLVRALGQAVRLGWRSEAGVVRHLIYWLEAARVAQRARALGAERLHAHFGTNAATVAMLAGTMGAPPFSLTVHGPEEFDKPDLIALGAKLKAADFAVAVSSFGRSQLMRHSGPWTWQQLHVVHCGIEPDKFPEPLPVSERRPFRLLAVGRLAEQKGFPTLIEAMVEVANRGVPVELTILGDGPMRGLLQDMINRSGLQDRVRMPGWRDEAGVRADLAGSHALVLPSYAEGLPVVLMEAMAAARPVIATWVAGIPELVHPGRNGWLVPPSDAPALASAILDAATTPNDTLVRMGKSARARALARHTIDTEAGKLARLFAQRPRTQSDR